MGKDERHSTSPLDDLGATLASEEFGASVVWHGSAPVIGELPPSVRDSTRFEIRRLLGRGTFGQVYLAYDRQLSRAVALKIPRTERLTAPEELDRFLREARAAASLRHSGIVTVYDVQSDKDGVFIVLEYVEGATLAEHAEREPLSLDAKVQLMIEMAQAIAYSHEHGLVHRDLKPSNILVDTRRGIRITDFGLAIEERGQHSEAREMAGTPAYMAPEQARGETHRLDGRTDVWSLGVIFYWLLTGSRAFDGPTRDAIFEKILGSEPRPPRQIVPEIPRELQRVCLKCLSKRMSDRYLTAHDLVDDLQHWLDRGPHGNVIVPGQAVIAPSDRSSVQPEAAVIPKGLRSFDQHDADFYVSLLPGPYDRNGLPESIRFWKRRIEVCDPSAAFSIGLMYGPSGCGKTSLLRAGILPRIAEHVRTVYVDAGPEHAEKRLRAAIGREFPELSPELSLVDSLRELREGSWLSPDQKLLIVLDQFEQWLSGREVLEDSLLVRALRHCDGGRLQCLVLIRDDFGMAATRFMNALEVPMLEGHNCAAMDVFRRDHAARVLRLFGEAFGGLSTSDQAVVEPFIEQALDLLSEGNTVSPVRLAAFAELMRHHDWTAAALKQLGGTQGLGVALLDTYLGEETANPTHRKHRRAARRVLEALLPEDRASVKGRMRSQKELMTAAGYQDRPREFEALLNMLDQELRLISPADPQQDVGEQPEADGAKGTERYYQLAHDYLVPSLDEWLTEKRRETRAGRAALLLETISSDWNARPDARRLPSVAEWISIRFWTQPFRWTAPQRRMMASAGRRLLVRLAMLFVAFTLGVVGLVYAYDYGQQLRHEQRARAVASQLLIADAPRVQEVLHELDALASPAARNVLRSAAASPASSDQERLRAWLFLAKDSEAARAPLLNKLVSLGPQEHRNVVERLKPYAVQLAPELWDRMSDTRSVDQILRLASALANWDRANSLWQRQGARIATAVARSGDPYHLPAWVEMLVPVRAHLTPTLLARFRDETSSSTERAAAATALVRFLRSKPADMAALASEAGPETFPLLFAELRQYPEIAVPVLHEIWSAEQPPVRSPEGDAVLRRRAIAAIALARLQSESALWSALEGDQSPDLRTAVIDRCSSYGLPPRILLKRLGGNGDPLGRQGALLALAEYGPRLEPDVKSDLLQLCLTLYHFDPHPGVHSGAEYVLRDVREPDDLAAARLELAAQDRGARAWEINEQGITFIIVRGPQEVIPGAPKDEPDREDVEEQMAVRLEYSFGISAHEITLEQFQRSELELHHAETVTHSDRCPANSVTWFDAVKYCRWLSEVEGIPEDEMCYPPMDQIGPQMSLPEDWQLRTGYRLPMESEWECACRANTATARFFGERADALPGYGRYSANSRGTLWPVGSLRPNPWGLFDVYGNVMEWCQDPWSDQFGAAATAQDSRYRVARGGTYRQFERDNHSAMRTPYSPWADHSFLGFRVARTVRD